MIVKVTVEHLGNDEFKLSNGKSADTLNPKELLLYATACCAGKTVTGIFSKQRITPRKFEISMYGNLDTETVMAQSTFDLFRIIYNLECSSEEEEEKISAAVRLADEKYCGTLKMIRRIAPVETEIAIVNTQPAKV